MSLKNRTRSFIANLFRMTDLRYNKTPSSQLSTISAIPVIPTGGVSGTVESMLYLTADSAESGTTDPQEVNSAETISIVGDLTTIATRLETPNTVRISAIGGGGSDSFKVKVSSDDTTEDYLENKIGANNGIDITVSPGNEVLGIGVDESELDHGTLANLGDDDHTQYALLAGRSGGQTIIGGTGSGDDLILQSTSNVTKGSIEVGFGEAVSVIIGGTLAGYVGIDSSGNLVVRQAAPSATTIHEFNADGSVILNEWGASVDIRAEGNTDANLLYLDGSEDKVGIGIAAPAYKLDVNGDVNVAAGSNFLIDGTPIGGGTASLTATYIGFGDGSNELTGTDNLTFDDANRTVTLFDTADNAGVVLSGKAGVETVFNEGSLDIDFRIEGNGDATLFTLDAGADCIGIGTSPLAKFDIVSNQTDKWGFKLQNNTASQTYPVGIIWQDSTTGAQPSLELRNDDADQPFIKFTGSVGSGSSYNIRSDNGSGSVVGPKGTTWAFASRMIRVDIGGSSYYIALYTG